MNDSISTTPGLPAIFQAWLQQAFLLEVLQNLLLILLLIVIFSLLYALLDLLLLCRQEYRSSQRAHAGHSVVPRAPRPGFLAAILWPSRK